MKQLIAYFSRPDENYVNGTLKYLTQGNTQKASWILQDLTGADLFEIKMKEPYAKDYNTCIAQAKEDKARQARPEIVGPLPDLDDIDVLYLGYPNYWNTMPMAVLSFLEQTKPSCRIYPFCTHEGSQMGASEADLKKACPNADIQPGLAIRGSQAASAGKALKKWIG